MPRALLAAIVIAAVPTVALAQPAAPTPSRASVASEAFDAALAEILARPGGLTAAVAGQRAIKANLTVARKQAEVDQTRSQLGQVTLALIPVTRLTASYTRLSEIDPIQLAPGVSLPQYFNSMHLGGEVSVPITDLVLRLPKAKKAIESQVVAGELGIHATELSAASDAEVAYYEWVRTKLAIVVAERQVAQLEATRAQVATLAEFQRASRADVLQLDAQKAQAELALAQVKQAVAIRAELLRIAIGASPDEELSIGEDVRETTPLPELASTGELTTQAAARRYEGRALDAGLRALDHHRAEAEVERLPKLSVFAQLNYDNPNQRIFPSSDEFNLTWAAGVSATWSVNSFLGVDPAVKAIDAQQRALIADRKSFELGVRAQVTSARSAAELADDAYAASQRGLAAAEESYQVRLDLYDNARATTLEVTSAETALTAARISAINALIDRRIAWAQLRHAAGLDLP